jgi:hypothetical protein
MKQIRKWTKKLGENMRVKRKTENRTALNNIALCTSNERKKERERERW